jgi:hypothetical protein
MYFTGGDQLVGVVGVHGVGAVRIPQTLGDAPKPAKITLQGVPLPTQKPVPPTFKGTHVGQFAIPRDTAQPAWKWDGKTWLIVPRAEAEKAIKDLGLKVKPTSAPVIKPTTPPVQRGRFVGDVFLPSDPTAHAWRWDGTVWRGVARSAAIKPSAADQAASTAYKSAPAPTLLDKIISAVAPNSAKVPDVSSRTNAPGLPSVTPPKPPTNAGRFVGEIFLPSNASEHAWRWNGISWLGIARSAAIKPSVADKQAAADYLLAQKQSFGSQVKNLFTGALVSAGHAETSLLDKLTAKLSPPTLQPHPEVATIAPGGAPPGYVNTSTGDQAKLPTKTDPDADHQMAPGVPAPVPTVGKPGTFPSTPLDPNGDGIVDATGKRAPPPTVGMKGTFPSTPLDKDGDGVIDSTGAPAPAPMLGQKGSFPATADDANGDGLNDTTGKPLNANPLSAMGLDLGSMAIPLLGVTAVLLLSGQKHGGSARQWR